MKRIITFSEKINNLQFRNNFANGLLILFLSLGFTTVFGQTKTTVTAAGTTSFTSPTGVTKVTVQAWGSGGAGGGSNVNKKPGSGGGGGAYNFSNTVTVSPGTTYTNSVVVGAGGTGSIGTTGTNGNASSVTFGSSLSANGGYGGAANNINTALDGKGGAAGTYAGGNGGSATQGVNGPGGGGGSSAGTASAGNNGTSAAAGAAVTGGGAGGAQGTQSNNGSAGSAPGGGGGGGGDKAGITNTAGGNGAVGRVIISYFLLTATSNVTVCNGAATIITVSGTTTNLPVGSYTVTYDLGSPNFSTNNSATMTVSSAGTGTFSTISLSNSGSTTITITSITAILGGINYGTSYDATGNANNRSTITVLASSVGGSITGGSTPICQGSNTGTMTLSGHTGSVVKWQKQFNGGGYSDIVNTATTYSEVPSSVGTWDYRAVVQNGSCTSVNSAIRTIVVDATTVGGSVSGTANICSGSTSGLLTLSGHTGTVVHWEYSVSPFSSWTTISNTSTTYTSGALTQTTHFRAVVQSGSCVTANASAAVITITTTTTTNGGASWDNGSPSSTKEVVYNGSSGTISSDISACSITLINNATVTVSSGVDVTLSGAITVNTGSTFTLNNNANLIQGGTTNTNSGNIVVKRDSSALIRLDYTLWSSPVSGQGLYAFSPFTFSNRFYVYRTTTNIYNNADIGFSITGLNGNGVNGTDSSNVPFATAKGYLIRMPWNHPTAATVWNGTFTGVPYNGDITYTMTSGAAGFRFNLVGNPYPSPISMSQFVLDNSSKITGTLYFWRETNNTTSNNAYCTWAGGTFTTNNEAQVFNPNGIIRTGQGFIVEALASQTVLSFNNGQRSSDNTNQFFKNNSLNNSTDTVETNRFWLNLSNSSGAFSQMAAGYMTDATDGVDIYDGKSINTGNVLLNSILNNEEYTIQGKSLPFNTADVIPLRYKVTDAGEYTITLDHVDGLFTGGTQPIYLKDNLTAIYHDLNTGAYSFTSTPGTFSDRFEIVYTTQLGTGNPIFTTNNVVIYNHNNEFVVNTSNVIMSSVKVFDIRGRLLEERKEINASQTTIGRGLTNQVLLVQITSEDGITVTKKVIK